MRSIATKCAVKLSKSALQNYRKMSIESSTPSTSLTLPHSFSSSKYARIAGIPSISFVLSTPHCRRRGHSISRRVSARCLLSQLVERSGKSKTVANHASNYIYIYIVDLGHHRLKDGLSKLTKS